MKNIILLGPPGSGKGTQSDRLVKEGNFYHLSTGDIIRDNIARQTPLAKIFTEIINSGDLVPDDIVVEMVADHLNHIKKDIIWDGFPRTINQAQALQEMLLKKNAKIDVVILLTVSTKTVVNRIAGRLSCPNCKKTYHLITNPPKHDHLCDNCGTKLMRRSDDEPEKVKLRLKTYQKDTAPLIAYYRDQNILCSIDAEQDPKQVYQQIKEIIYG